MCEFVAEFLRYSSKLFSLILVRRVSAARIALLIIAFFTATPRADATGPEEIAAQLRAASALHQRGDYTHSIPILKQVVRLSPRNYLANLLLGEDLLSSGRPQDALEPLRAASLSRPNDIVALDYMVVASQALGDSATESETLQSVVARSGGDERHLLLWATFCLSRFRALEMALLDTRKGEGAELRITAWSNPEGSEANEALLKQSAAADPDQRGIWGELGISQFDLGKQVEAQSSLNEAEKRDPQEAATLRLEALFAAADHKWQIAEEHLLTLGTRSPAELDKALRLWPPSLAPGLWVVGPAWDCIRNYVTPCPLISTPPRGGEGMSAKDLYVEGRWEELNALPEAALVDSTEWLWRGVARFRTGDCKHAIPALEHGLKADEREGSFYLQVCYANEEGQVEDRLTEAGNQGALHGLKGDRALSLRNDPATAQKEYVEALRSRPKDARLLARLADAYRLQGDSTQARTAALSSLAIDPSQTSALQTVVQVDMKERNYAEALIRLKQLAVLLPQDAWAQVELGIAYGQLGHPGEAVHFLGPQLEAGFPDRQGVLHAQLAAALRKLGRGEEAKQAAAEASRLANASLDSRSQENLDAP
jgi:tetratricopeptide (TPR) repeat protein